MVNWKVKRDPVGPALPGSTHPCLPSLEVSTNPLNSSGMDGADAEKQRREVGGGERLERDDLVINSELEGFP